MFRKRTRERTQIAMVRDNSQGRSQRQRHFLPRSASARKLACEDSKVPVYGSFDRAFDGRCEKRFSASPHDIEGDIHAVSSRI